MPDDATEIPERVFPYTMKLRHPISFGKDETITELVFQRGRVAFVKDLKPDGVPTIAQSLLIASRLCGKPVAALELLDPDDSGEVIEIAMSFFGRCLGATGTP